ncbi:MAG: hypothetical protein Q4E06_01520 [Lautropia sp.]|nr:hypothetical protein [Lautropia sp.]
MHTVNPQYLLHTHLAKNGSQAARYHVDFAPAPFNPAVPHEKQVVI